MDPRRPTRALLILTFATGVIDAASFLALGGVFAAMQTGNVIFLGIGIVGAGDAPVLAPLIGLAAFMVGGVVAATAMHRRGSSTKAGANILLLWLALEVALLASVAVLALLIDVTPGHISAYCPIALLSLTMGLRNSAVRGSAGPNLATTVLNLALTAVTPDALPGLANQADLRERAAAFVAILAGAFTGALLVKSSLSLAMVLAAAAALGAALTIALRRAQPV